jgi:hypothetical protein
MKQDIIIYKPIVTSQDIMARDEIVRYLQEHYGIGGIKPEMVRFRIADESGELLKNPSWEFHLEEYFKHLDELESKKPKGILQRIKSWFKK